MNNEHQEQVEPDSHGEETYVESLGMLELLIEHGKKIEIPIYGGKEIRIGRDGNKCQYVLRDDIISKQHFRIYSIIYEKDKLHDFPPLIYCEDLESTNGTYVNDICIGMIGRERIGHLLSDGDIIEIKPNTRFRFHQPIHQPEFRTKEQLIDLYHFKDRFDVSDRVLGQGSYGAVYLANEVATSRQIACKIVDIDLAADQLTNESGTDVVFEDWNERLRRLARGKELVMREVRILSKLSHPHIINLKKAFITNSSLYILIELAPGGDLFSYIESHGGRLNDWHSRVIARQLVLAIQYMHSNSIAHRDIKPENVLIMQTDFGGRVVLTDFGFANYINQRTGRLLSRVGTAGFIAPEVESTDAENSGYTKAADLWSLGILTATLLTGSSMVAREHLAQMSRIKVVERFLGDDPDTSTHWPNLTTRALSFLRGLLVLNPDKRLTATEALNHSWFKKPLSEATLLEERYEKVLTFWRRRGDDEVIENIPSRPQASQEYQVITTVPKPRRMIPDSTLSPYFGLDRHLQPKVASKRKIILETLNESGSPFLVSEKNPNKTRFTSPRPLTRNFVDIKTVKGIDLFAAYRSMGTTTLKQPDLDEECLLPATRLVQHNEQAFRVDMGVSLRALSSPADETRINASEEGFGTGKCKRLRRESEDPEERSIRDSVAKALPRYSTAKVLRDAVDKKKQEIKSKALGGLVTSVPAA